MADDEQIGQDEIEELLRQAQGGAEASTPQPPEQSSEVEDDAALGQSEIEALLNAGASGAAAPQAGAAGQPSAAPPPPAAAPPPTPNVPETVGANRVSGDDIDLLLKHAQEAIGSVDNPSEADLEGIASFELPDFAGTPPSTEKATIDLLSDVELDLKIELGRTHMYLEEVLQLGKGSVVPLDKLAGDPVDIYVNGRLIARGEVLVLNDNFCVRVAELISGDDMG